MTKGALDWTFPYIDFVFILYSPYGLQNSFRTYFADYVNVKFVDIFLCARARSLRSQFEQDGPMTTAAYTQIMKREYESAARSHTQKKSISSICLNHITGITRRDDLDGELKRSDIMNDTLLITLHVFVNRYSIINVYRKSKFGAFIHSMMASGCFRNFLSRNKSFSSIEISIHV